MAQQAVLAQVGRLRNRRAHGTQVLSLGVRVDFKRLLTGLQNLLLQRVGAVVVLVIAGAKGLRHGRGAQHAHIADCA